MGPLVLSGVQGVLLQKPQPVPASETQLLGLRQTRFWQKASPL
jgi:hypothetical protein